MADEFLVDGSRISSAKFNDLQSRDLLSIDDVLRSKRGESFTINCVGFAINRCEETLIIYPKQYQHNEGVQLSDFLPIFGAIQKVQSSTAASESGPRETQSSGLELDYNFPFGAFFHILNYYRRYGLHFDDVRRITP